MSREEMENIVLECRGELSAAMETCSPAEFIEQQGWLTDVATTLTGLACTSTCPAHILLEGLGYFSQADVEKFKQGLLLLMFLEAVDLVKLAAIDAMPQVSLTEAGKSMAASFMDKLPTHILNTAKSLMQSTSNDDEDWIPATLGH